MTRSFPVVSRIGGMLRGLTHSDATGHGGTDCDGDIPEWVIGAKAARGGRGAASADQRLVLPPRLGVFF